ncbi:ankyrin repeat domain-containing protein [candidate division KSB1 bacterium]
MNFRNFLLIVVLIAIGTNPLFGQDIFTAIRNKDIAAVREYVENDPELINTKDRNQMTPLYFAAYYGITDAVDYLIEKGSDVKYRRSNGEAAIHLASYFNFTEVVRLLVENGEDVSVESYRGRTPIYSAIEGGAKDVADYLLDNGAEVPLIGSYLHRAAKKGLKRVVDLMIENGVEVTLEFDGGSTLLHSAAEGGLVDLARLAVERGVDINKRDYYGIAPMHLAAGSGQNGLVEFLLQNGAEIDIKTYDGRTPYHLAAVNGHPIIMNFLSDNDAKPEIVKYIDGEGDIYLGQEKPGSVSEVFALGIISIDEGEHGAPAFSPNGDEIYWAYNFRTTYYTKKEDGKWLLPRSAPIWEKYGATNPVFSSDGKKLYFHSGQTMDDEKKKRDSDIWYVEKTSEGWSDPVNMGPQINSESNETFRSFTENGTIYFISDYDIYRSEFINGEYQTRVRLSEPLNSDSPEISVCVAPDESFLIFESMRPGGEEELMLWICFREQDGTWSDPVSMGSDINGDGARFPGLSPDGKYFFFSKNFDIYWVDARIIEELRKR